MKNKIHNFLIIILLFSLQSFLYAEINYVNKKGMTIETRYNTKEESTLMILKNLNFLRNKN